VSLNLALSSSLVSGCGTYTVLKPDGSALVGATTTCSTATFIDTLVLPVAGTYAVVFNPSKTATGSATFTLYDVPPDASATVSINGSAVTLATSVPGQNAAATFTAGAGVSVTVRITGNTMGTVTVRLRKPDGSVQVTKTISGASSDLTPQTLATGGTYTVSIDPNGKATGSISVAVTSP
jgi:hypothetical protein